MRGMMVISFGLFIDFLQAIFGWMALTLGAGFAGAAPVVGTISGATVTCVVGGVAAGIVTLATLGGALPTAAAAAAACAALGVGGAAAGGAAGAAVGAAGIPLGIGLGFAGDVCLSLTMGAGFILLLAFNKMLYPGYVWSVFIGESIPGLDVIPGWTFLAIRCVMKKNAEENNGVTALASGIASAALSPTSAAGGLGGFARGILNMKAQTGTMARSSPLVNKIYESSPVQDAAHERQQLAGDVKSRIHTDITPPRSPEGTRQQYAKAA